MKEKKLKELYNAEIENSAPDFDALWSKIENNLEPKPEPPIIITPAKPNFKIIAAAAACVLYIIGASVLTNNMDFVATEDMQTSETDEVISNSDNATNQAPQMDNVSEEAAESNRQPLEHETILNYEDLSFTSYSETIIPYWGEPYGDSYFVEEQVLSEAENIIRGIVQKAYGSEDGKSICYQLEVKECYPENNEAIIVVESRSSYTMKRGREYLLPVAKNEDGYRTVFDSIPQIEFTADEGLVYYNGWSNLDNSDCVNIIYPISTDDEFFYDRMRFSYSGDFSVLIEKFMNLKAS